MKKVILIVFLFATKLTLGQIKNSGFEVWDTVFTNTYSDSLSSEYGIPNPLGGTINSWKFDYRYGICQTTDSYLGKYSLIMHNWYSSHFERISYQDSISFRPEYLKGYFKYITGGKNKIAQGTATVILTRFNGISNDTIGKGKYLFDSTIDFTAFQIKINYTSSLTPDSIKIFIVNSDKTCQGSNMICHLLYLDNLTLTNTSLSLKDIKKSKSPVMVYPNPTHSELNIQSYSGQSLKFSFYNSLGELILSKLLTENISIVNLSAFSNGVYFYKLTTDENNIITGKVIKH